MCVCVLNRLRDSFEVNSPNDFTVKSYHLNSISPNRPESLRPLVNLTIAQLYRNGKNDVSSILLHDIVSIIYLST